MPSGNLKHFVHLHLIVFIWGFTAVIGKLISLDALPLVWYRMALAMGLVFVYLKYKKYALKLSLYKVLALLGTGAVIALHWVTFFKAIKVSNVSIALACMSVGALFAALLEPLWYKRKMIGYEVVFGLLVVLGLGIIFRVETQYWQGILLAISSAFLVAVFSLLNGNFIKTLKPSVIAFYEMAGGVLLLSIYLVFKGSFTSDFWSISPSDFGYLFLLSSLCTAYAFIASVKLMAYISPYSVMLTTNMEPVYGILLAFVVFGESEHMSSLFYLGALLILVTVIANGILKSKSSSKTKAEG
ncbi:DMT family transporter [Flavobacteriaceae bacterium LSUCC0859]|nr:DMT family transporter [Flavobacteriaceae bacterium LSUCC0859]